MDQVKRRRRFRWQKNGSNKLIVNSMCGLFFTVDGNDKRALREAYNLIDSFILHDEVSNIRNDESDCKDASSTNIDVSDVLSQMCTKSRDCNKEKSSSSSIHQLDTGVKHTFFFTIPSVLTPGNVYDIAEQMVVDCQKDQHCRFLARLLPIEDTCVDDISALPERLARMTERHFRAFEGDHPPTYAVEFKARNSDLLSRKGVIDITTDTVQNLSPGSRVNLTNPDLLIIVNVLRKSILLSCVKDYYTMNRYTTRPVKAESNPPGIMLTTSQDVTC